MTQQTIKNTQSKIDHKFSLYTMLLSYLKFRCQRRLKIEDESAKNDDLKDSSLMDIMKKCRFVN